MANLPACPGPDQLKSISLGVMPEKDAEALLEHLEQCPRCATGMSVIVAEDTLVEAIRAKETVKDSEDQQAVSRLVEKVRALVPEAKGAADPTLDSAAPASAAAGDTAAFSWVDPPAQEEQEGDGLAPPLAPDEIGRLGPYRVLKVLGEGGMGKVFLAEDPNLQRSVALKVMKATLAKNASARQRFLREARLAAKIEHDHIVHIYQVGEDRGIPFLAMQLLKGSSLEDLLRRAGVLKIKQVLHLGSQIAQGLAAAHEHGMIHRDIKPSNIWIEPTDGGRVKILDFGLARISTGEVGITQSGTILGTPAYMPPEQARGEKVDQRCDLYSLGCVLYRMATGELPLKGTDTMSMLMALALHEVVAPTQLNPEIPPPLADLIMKLLVKDPHDRVGSAKEVVAALKAIERGDNVPAPHDTAVLSPSMLQPRPDLPLPSLVEETATKSEQALSARQVAPPRRRVAILAAVALLALIGSGILFGGQIFRIVTNQGELVVEVKDPNVEVKIVQNGVVVQDKTSKREFTLTAGKGAIEVLEKDGIKLTTKQFELTRGGKTTVTVTLQELAEARQPKDPGPAEKKDPQAQTDEDWPRRVAALPAAQQVQAVAAKLQERNPGFDGKVTPKYEGNVVAELRFLTDHVKDIAPVRALTGLRKLTCGGSGVGKGQLADLSPLKNLKLTYLYIRFTKVAELSPLQEMKLTELWCDETKVADLSPLKKMKLTKLGCNRTRVIDLSPLKGMPLTALAFWNTGISDLSPLKGMKLTHLNCAGAKVSDLTPLRGMPLVEIDCRPRSERDIGMVRSLKTLKTINLKPAAEFWKDMDARQAAFDAWLKQVAVMSAKEQVKAVADKLKERNPGFNGKVTPKYEGDQVTELQFSADKVTDISPVRALTQLRSLHCRGTRSEKDKRAPLADLSPLKDMKLTKLYCHSTNVDDLAPLKDMKLTVLVFNGTKVTDLSPLQDMPLASLQCWQAPVSDLAPLKGMPLTALGIAQTRVTDLSPLKDMKLETLSCWGTKVTDLSPLRGMPVTEYDGPFNADRHAEILRAMNTTLTKINKKPAVEFWKEVDALPAFADWLKAVAAMPAKEQVKAVADKLKERNPGFDGKITSHKIDDGVVTELQFLTDHVTDIAPVRALPGLRTLLINDSGKFSQGKYWPERNSKLADLAPLEGMKLLHLGISGTHVSDLSPLQEMKLETLRLGYTLVRDLSPLKDMKLTSLEFFKTAVSDLSPLKDMKLAHLNCASSQVSDLSPLKGMPLTYLRADVLTRMPDLSPLAGMPLEFLSIAGIPVSDLSPLKGMPLKGLWIESTWVSDLSPLQGMKLTSLYCDRTRVADLTPLRGMPLKELQCPYNPARDTDILRSIVTLKRINRKPALEFWNEVNAQQAAFNVWLKQVAALPPTQQVKAVGDKLKELNPDFDGKIVSHKIDQAGVVTALKFWTDNVTDISPVRALTGLTDLDCRGTASGKGKLVDLWPLKGMKLTTLNFGGTKVTDLSALKNMNLTILRFQQTKVTDLSSLKDMKLIDLDCWQAPVSDLAPLKDMKLTHLTIAQTKVFDLTPLKDMPLTLLTVWATKVSDLSPLRGMPLVTFDGPFKADRDAEVLRSIMTLKTINKKPAAEFWKDVDAKQAAFDAWLKLVAAMPAEKQAGAVGDKLKESNPGFDGTTIPTIDYKAGVVTGLEVRSDKITDISPVRALTGLQTFNCAGSSVADLSSLKDLKLTVLDCSATKVADLGPLKGMPLMVLKCHETLVGDLSPLQGMPLKEIQCDFNGERDAEVLRSIKTLQKINGVPAAEFWKDMDDSK